MYARVRIQRRQAPFPACDVVGPAVLACCLPPYRQGSATPGAAIRYHYSIPKPTYLDAIAFHSLRAHCMTIYHPSQSDARCPVPWTQAACRDGAIRKPPPCSPVAGVPLLAPFDRSLGTYHAIGLVNLTCWDHGKESALGSSGAAIQTAARLTVDSRPCRLDISPRPWATARPEAHRSVDLCLPDPPRPCDSQRRPPRPPEASVYSRPRDSPAQAPSSTPPIPSGQDPTHSPTRCFHRLLALPPISWQGASRCNRGATAMPYRTSSHLRSAFCGKAFRSWIETAMAS